MTIFLSQNGQKFAYVKKKQYLCRRKIEINTAYGIKQQTNNILK